MKVLYVAPRFHTNQFYATKAFLDNNWIVEFHVIEKEFSEDYTYLNPLIIKSNYLYKLTKKLFKLSINQDRLFLLPSFNFLLKYFSESRPDLIIIRNPHYIYSFLYVIFGKLFGCKVLLYTQDVVHKKKKKNWRQFYCHLLTIILRLAWFSPVLGDLKEPKISKNLFYIPIPYEIKNLDSFKKVNQIDERIKILMVGKFASFKRHIFLLKAIYEMKIESIELTIIGEKTSDDHNLIFEDVVNFIKEKNMDDLVKIITNISFKDMYKYYQNSDLFILPSKNDVFSVSPLEAMSYGVPVVVSEHNGFKYNIIEGNNGYTFKTDDINDLKNKLLNFIDKRNNINFKTNCIDYVSVAHGLNKYFVEILKISKLDY